MDGIQIGYARVSTTDQDLTAQRVALLRLGVADAQIYVGSRDDGSEPRSPWLAGSSRSGEKRRHFVVTRLDRLARSLRDARDIADELTAKGAALSLGGSRYDPTDPVVRLLFNMLGMVAEFERDLISMRTREGMAVARAKGRLKGKQPKLSRTQRALLFELGTAETTARRKLLNCSACLERPFIAGSNAAGQRSSPHARRTSIEVACGGRRNRNPLAARPSSRR